METSDSGDSGNVKKLAVLAGVAVLSAAALYYVLGRDEEKDEEEEEESQLSEAVRVVQEEAESAAVDSLYSTSAVAQEPASGTDAPLPTGRASKAPIGIDASKVSLKKRELSEDEELRELVGQNADADAGQDAELFPFTLEAYKGTLGRLHQCFCGKTSADTKLKRCSGCKATYFCSDAHYREGFLQLPHKHKEFCPQLEAIVKGGFEAVEEWMQVFHPRNLPNITPTVALQGWSIACRALEAEIYQDTYEEGKLLVWAGTTQAILSGLQFQQRAQRGQISVETLVSCFGASMNFFYNGIEVVRGTEREIEVLPFCQFEIFGLWSSIALAYKESDPARMAKMMVRGSIKYGHPAVLNLIQLLREETPSLQPDAGFEYLRGWTMSNVTMLVRKMYALPYALEMVEALEEFAEDTGLKPAAETATLARCVYDACIEAKEATEQRTGKAPADWDMDDFAAFDALKDQRTQQLMQQAFPELAAMAGRM